MRLVAVAAELTVDVPPVIQPSKPPKPFETSARSAPPLIGYGILVNEARHARLVPWRIMCPLLDAWIYPRLYFTGDGGRPRVA